MRFATSVLLPHPCAHVLAKQGVDMRLISLAKAAKPPNDICVEAQSDLLLRWPGWQALSSDDPSEPLGRQFRDVGEVDARVALCVHSLPISLRIRGLAHVSLPFGSRSTELSPLLPCTRRRKHDVQAGRALCAASRHGIALAVVDDCLHNARESHLAAGEIDGKLSLRRSLAAVCELTEWRVRFAGRSVYSFDCPGDNYRFIEAFDCLVASQPDRLRGVEPRPH